MNARTLLGFDYGTKRIGVAVGQEITRTARPLTTLSYSATNPVWPHIQQIFKEWQPHGIVVGLPTHLDGTAHAMTLKTQDFIRSLQQAYPLLPIYTIDERLTSYLAEADLALTRSTHRQSAPKTHARKIQAKAQIDQKAAQIILQAWLDEPTMALPPLNAPLSLL